ncbi:MAG TPA: MarR family transcriptional regulator [Candidatus Paceibacterota bacterium]|nr:MarR family transcriptional regulator [Candidatus Paceibacterota bacterium]
MHTSHARSTGDLMLALRRKLTERGHSFVLKDELSMTQFEVLWFVSCVPSISMDAIAERLSIKPPSATALITTLERKGYIKRSRDPKDRRVVNVALTPSAKRQLGTLQKRKDRMFESLLSKLSAKDRKEFIRLLTILTKD